MFSYPLPLLQKDSKKLLLFLLFAFSCLSYNTSHIPSGEDSVATHTPVNELQSITISNYTREAGESKMFMEKGF